MRRGVLRRPPPTSVKPAPPAEARLAERSMPRAAEWIRPLTWEELTPIERAQVIEQRGKPTPDDWYVDEYGDLRPKTGWD